MPWQLIIVVQRDETFERNIDYVPIGSFIKWQRLANFLFKNLKILLSIAVEGSVKKGPRWLSLSPCHSTWLPWRQFAISSTLLTR